MDQKLEGFLQKQGERGLKGYKKRYMVEKNAEIFYYKNKNDSKAIGSINLVEALRCEVAKEGKTHFKIYTPRRIWHLVAENEEQASVWVNGVSRIIAKLQQEDSNDQPTSARASVRYQTMENRIRDLESSDEVLKKALSIAAAKAGMSVADLLIQAEQATDDADKEETEAPKADVAKEAAKEEEAEAAKEEASAEKAPEEKQVEKEAEKKEMEQKEAEKKEEEQKDADPKVKDEEKETEEKESKEEANAGDSKSSGKFQACVLYDYTAQQDYEMTITTGETITVLSKHGNGWWLGASADGKQGYFPGSYVDPL